MTLFNKRQARLLVPGFHPDPSVCSDRPGHLVLAFSSFEYFPGLPVWESSDSGRTWTFCSHAASRADQFTDTPLGNSRGFYAPTIRFHDECFYLIVTDVNRGAMIFTTHDLHDRWEGPVMVEGWPGIDPSLLFDDDGSCYICGNESGGGERPGIYAAAVNPDTGEIQSARHFLIGGITGANPEGPHLYHRGDFYYLMWAEGGTEAGHMECMARSRSVFGPYESDPHNPILTNRSTHLDPQCIGHADFAPLDGAGPLGEDFLVFLGLRTNADYPQQGWLGRENFGARLSWGYDGWPRLEDQSFFIDADDPGCALPVADPADDWIMPGVPRAAFAQVTRSRADAKSGLVEVRMRALPETGDLLTDYDSLHGPRLIGRRQTSLQDDFEVHVEIPRRDASQEDVPAATGAIVYANAHVWARAYVDGRRRRLVCDVEDLGLHAVLASVPLPHPEAASSSAAPDEATSYRAPLRALALRVHATNEGYDFYADPGATIGHGPCLAPDAGADDSAPGRVFLGHVPCQIFASTHAGGFTGLLYGVYARGTGVARFLCR